MHEHTPDLRKKQYVRKDSQISALREKLNRSLAAVLVEYRGMTVKETSELRTRLRKVNAELNIAKNTLVKRALDGTPVTGLSEHLTGPTAVLFAYEDTVAAVKTTSDYTRESRFLTLKAGYIEGRTYNAAQLVEIAKMPPREQIYSTLLGSLQAPAANLVGMLQAPAAQLVF